MIDINTAAEKLNLTPQQVRNLCRDGKLNAQKVGNSWVLNEEEVTYHYDNSTCGTVENKKRTIKTDKPIALSFFSGAMGMDIGLEQAGFEVLLACEVDNACRKTITKNKPETALIGDVRNYNAEEIREKAGLSATDDIDLIVGGPPCQAFSTAGKRKGFEDERGNVFLNFIDLIADLNPKYAVIENVRGLLSAPLKHRPHAERGEDTPGLSAQEEKGGALFYILEVLEKKGYTVSFNLYNAANFGTPQNRERVVLICSRDGKKPPYLEPTHAGSCDLYPNLKKAKTFLDVVKDLKDIKHTHINFPEKRLKYYRMLKAGENWRALPIPIQMEAMGKSFYSGGGKTGFLRRLAWDKPAPTLLTHPAMPATDLSHPTENRPLSIEEYKRVQEFPDDWKIEGSILEQYRQIGNAVPVGLGRVIGQHILKLIKGEPIKEYKNYRYSRYRRTRDDEWIKEYLNRIEKHNTLFETYV